ncbi:MAG: hypothetical protein LBR39_03565 [Coriobacteriales bacterium]|nr:hypothetical protein [Coriobacteriales bacterium]
MSDNSEQKAQYQRRRALFLRVAAGLATAAALALFLVAFNLMNQTQSTELQASDTTGLNHGAVSDVEQAKVEAPPLATFVAIEPRSALESISWEPQAEYGRDGLLFAGYDTEALLSENALEAVVASTTALEEAGNSVGFVLLDLNTGLGLAYHTDLDFYSASSIKGPYVAADIAAYPEDFSPYELSIEAILVDSNNDVYESFYMRRLDEPLDEWYDRAGVDLNNNNPMYPYYSPRELGLLWLETYDFLSSDAPYAAELAGYYSYPANSVLHSQLDWRGATWSKAGWYAFYEQYDGFTTSPSACDAGIIFAEGHPYLLVLMCDCPGNLAALYDLANSLDVVHQELSELGPEALSSLMG